MDFNKMKAALKGLQVGGTLGGSDELAGATQGLMSLINPEQLDVNKKLKDQGFTGDIGPTTTEEMYTQGRNEERSDIDTSKKAFPKEFYTGQLGGTALGALMPGPTVLNASKPLTAAASGAGWGALGGTLSSDQEGIGRLQDVAIGSSVGALGGATFSKLKSKINPEDINRVIGNEVGAVGRNIRNDVPASAVLEELESPTMKAYLDSMKQYHGAGSESYQIAKQKLVDGIRENISKMMDLSNKGSK